MTSSANTPLETAGPFPRLFNALTPYADWALVTERERLAKRTKSSFHALQCAYDAITPHVVPALDYLNEIPLDRLQGADLRLLYLMLSYAEIAFAVEMYGAPDSPHSVSVDDMIIVNDSFDFHSRP
jgi:hypothetical protein